MSEPTRIEEIPENELTDEQAKVFKDLVAGRGRLLAPYKIWIHSPKLAAALETIGTFLNKRSSLSERERAVCVLAKIAMAPGGGSDEVYTRAEQSLGRNGIAEVLALLGYYSAVSMGVKVHRVPVPA